MTSDAQSLVTSRRGAFPAGFVASMPKNWGGPTPTTLEVHAAAAWAAKRRASLSALFPESRIVVRAGDAQIRNNDMEHPYRPSSEFTYLTGWGVETIPGSVLVIEPSAAGGHATLFTHGSTGTASAEFYENAAIGEFWVGPRKPLAQLCIELAVPTLPLATFTPDAGDLTPENSFELKQAIDELRVVKDPYEIDEITEAVNITARGFDDVVAKLGAAQQHPRGERVVESVFHMRARTEGNREGYGTIAAAGDNAYYLHWMQNTGRIDPGDLLLLDAGVEVDSLYTADVTRTVPASGTFSPVQRRVYEAVLEAADAALAASKVGVPFREMHSAAMKVIARHLEAWGLLGVSAEEALDVSEGGQHRRYMIHGTSHHLGLDVHDCATARDEMYMDALLQPGMVFTVEPGLYFHANDLSVPKEYRGIGVRIEDDILMTADGPVNLSARIPRTADEVEAWVAPKKREGHRLTNQTAPLAHRLGVLTRSSR